MKKKTPSVYRRRRRDQRIESQTKCKRCRNEWCSLCGVCVASSVQSRRQHAQPTAEQAYCPLQHLQILKQTSALLSIFRLFARYGHLCAALVVRVELH